MKVAALSILSTSPADGLSHFLDAERAAASATRALVIGPYLTPRRRPSDGRVATLRMPEARLAEAVGLAAAIELDLVGGMAVALSEIRPSTFLGKGKVEEIATRVRDEAIALVIMDCALTPVQQRNLEKEFGAKVIDRTGLILEIFGRRARTREGRLQVELAHLAYQKSRLVRSWTHLERQRGGFGFLGGPGETQIETDRRMIDERMARISIDLDKVKRTRSLNRKGRSDVPFPVVALVGYTNAGKSTLFNRLTQAERDGGRHAVRDPRSRPCGCIMLPHRGKVVLSDTVGFISELPTMLVSSFRATLEEVVSADVILHVRDIAHEDSDAQNSPMSRRCSPNSASMRPNESWSADRGLEQGGPARRRGARQALDGQRSIADKASPPVVVSAADRPRHRGAARPRSRRLLATGRRQSRIVTAGGRRTARACTGSTRQTEIHRPPTDGADGRISAGGPRRVRNGSTAFDAGLPAYAGRDLGRPEDASQRRLTRGSPAQVAIALARFGVGPEGVHLRQASPHSSEQPTAPGSPASTCANRRANFAFVCRSAAIGIDLDGVLRQIDDGEQQVADLVGLLVPALPLAHAIGLFDLLQALRGSCPIDVGRYPIQSKPTVAALACSLVRAHHGRERCAGSRPQATMAGRAGRSAAPRARPSRSLLDARPTAP